LCDGEGGGAKGCNCLPALFEGQNDEKFAPLPTLQHNRKRSARYWGGKINNIINGSWVYHCSTTYKLYHDEISFYRCQFYFFSIRVVLVLKYLMSAPPTHCVCRTVPTIYLEHEVNTRHNLSMSRHTGTYVWLAYYTVYAIKHKQKHTHTHIRVHYKFDKHVRSKSIKKKTVLSIYRIGHKIIIGNIAMIRYIIIIL